MAKVKVTWKTMQDSFFIPARTSETPMPRPRKVESDAIPGIAPAIAAVSEESLASAR